MTKKTLVVGVGNPILSDDGAGIAAVRKLRNQVDGVDFAEASLSGLELVETFQGYERVILVDAVKTTGGRPGDIYRLGVDDNPTLHGVSPHDMDYRTHFERRTRLHGEPVYRAEFIKPGE